jgi:hypothetical protein
MILDYLDYVWKGFEVEGEREKYVQPVKFALAHTHALSLAPFVCGSHTLRNMNNRHTWRAHVALMLLVCACGLPRVFSFVSPPLPHAPHQLRWKVAPGETHERRISPSSIGSPSLVSLQAQSPLLSIDSLAEMNAMIPGRPVLGAGLVNWLLRRMIIAQSRAVSGLTVQVW